MPRQIITTASAPSSPLYSQAVKAGPHVLLSGMAGIDPTESNALQLGVTKIGINEVSHTTALALC